MSLFKADIDADATVHPHLLQSILGVLFSLEGPWPEYPY